MCSDYSWWASAREIPSEEGGKPGASFVEDLFAVDKHIADAWRLRRSFRCELSETEKPDNGMLSPAMPNVLRYVNCACRKPRSI